ncbi:DUF4129 domain-containing protein [Actinocrispum wychmicini]|uniref:Uncharacterized protein DUF4129 n=1 Tax=Actinocrispum wychmicini TaxID=1213861 RepID=A0A4R2JJ20_9PSEU|nr:DUF4129 domain-containing protein [Actinocrispum wychmicini]TCO58462.1 uncharacterized protein DUF4129 [Actinocrispum wychmicini]
MKVRVPVLLAVGALVLLAVVAARGTSGIPTGQRVFGPASSGQVGGTTGTGTTSLEPVAYGAALLIVLIAVMSMVGLSVFLVSLTAIRFWRRRGRRVRQPALLDDESTSGDAQEWVARAAGRALSEMDRREGGPPSDAVIAAWVQLERDAAASGTERKPHQTPTEFTAEVLATMPTDPVALERLRTLYQRARFGPADSVTEADVAAAKQALLALGREKVKL